MDRAYRVTRETYNLCSGLAEFQSGQEIDVGLVFLCLF